MDGAKAGLTNIRHVCQIFVADIIALGLSVTADDDPQKVHVSGMPLKETDSETAYAIAKDLRNLATMVP